MFYFGNERQTLFPLLHRGKKGPDEPRPGHTLQRHGVIVQCLQHFVARTEHVPTILVSFDVFDHVELHLFPGIHYFTNALKDNER